MKTFWLCFVPLFVAVDAIGVLPIFVALTEQLDQRHRRRVLIQSVLTAGIVAVTFLWLGPLLLGYLGISVADFMIAGGILLLAISLNDLLTGGQRQHNVDPTSLGAVPIGVPLITGPAVLTTCILLAGLHGRWPTTVAVIANIALAGLMFRFADPLTLTLGRTGTRATSKLASLLLAAIAVMLMRKGISETLSALWSGTR